MLTVVHWLEPPLSPPKKSCPLPSVLRKLLVEPSVAGSLNLKLPVGITPVPFGPMYL